ncbi:restriction endonuclease subunit S [Streptomyces niveus]|uniref:restriction endonuclease subunit S n=1 Tax=Streptomyces niveus TaxID=193462 RepID=UPI0036E9A8F0
MSDWQQISLGDLETPVRRKVAVPPQGSRASVSGGYPLRPLGDVVRLDIQRTPMKPATTYRLAGVLNAGKGVVDKGELDGGDTEYAAMNVLHTDQVVMRKLTAWEGPITVVPAEFDGFVVSNEFPTFTLGPELMPDWMRHVCRSPRLWAEMKNRVSGTVQRRKRLNPEQLLQIQLPIPPREVQGRIVEMLDAVDDQINALNAEADTLERALDAWIATVFSTADNYAPLGDIAEVQLGKMLSKERAAGPDQAPYIRNADVQWQGLNLTDLKTMTFTEKDRARYSLRAGDILSCEGGDPGRSVILSEDLDGIYYQKAVHRVRATGVDSRFLYVAIKHSYASGAIADLCTVTTIKHLTAEKYRTLHVPLLSEKRQLRAVEVHDVFFAQVSAIRAEANRLRGARASLLSGLLDRTIDIKSAEQEV